MNQLIAGIPLTPDGGPIYAETDFSEFPVEPWNAWSSLTFWIPALYWIWRIYRSGVSHRFLFASCLLLLLGGLGSALYHAFREYPLLLAMDVAPIALLTMSVSVFFWNRILKKTVWVIIITLAVLISRYVLFRYLHVETQTAINLSYFISGTFMLLPVLMLLFRTSWFGWKNFIGTLLFLLLALACRAYDEESQTVIPMGIHWLWHSFTAVAAWFLGNYLFQLNNRNAVE